MPNSYPLRSDDNQYAKVKRLLERIKDKTKKPHIFNLIDALENWLERLQNGQ